VSTPWAAVGFVCVQALTYERRRRLFADAESVIANRYREPLTVTEVAGALAVSVRQLQRVYAEVASISFSERLAAARLAAAAELLAEQSIGVAEIARIVGYRHRGAFAAAFLRHYGLGPAGFRRAARAARASRQLGTPRSSGR
jgi:transcriptional regulator GlxA family with amidase domain